MTTWPNIVVFNLEGEFRLYALEGGRGEPHVTEPMLADEDAVLYQNMVQDWIGIPHTEGPRTLPEIIRRLFYHIVGPWAAMVSEEPASSPYAIMPVALGGARALTKPHVFKLIYVRKRWILETCDLDACINSLGTFAREQHMLFMCADEPSNIVALHLTPMSLPVDVNAIEYTQAYLDAWCAETLEKIEGIRHGNEYVFGRGECSGLPLEHAMQYAMIRCLQSMGPL